MKNDNPDKKPLTLDDMQRLWDEQSRRLEGQSLINDADIARALRAATPAEKPAPVRRLLWSRVAAAAVVLLVAATLLWRWQRPDSDAPLSASGSPQQEQLPASGPQQPQEEPFSPAFRRPLQEETPGLQNPLPDNNPALQQKPLKEAPAPLYAALPESAAAAQSQSPATDTAVLLSAPAEAPQNLADATPSQSTVPAASPLLALSQRHAADTLVVVTSRLVRFDSPRRKSLTETLLETLLVSK